MGQRRDSGEPLVTPGVVRVPNAGLAGAVTSTLLAEGGFNPEDLMVMAAITSVGARRDALPPPHRSMLELAFGHLGLEPDADDEAIKAAVQARLKARPIHPELLQALERFRTDVLPAEQSRDQKENAARLLGERPKATAPTVPSPREKTGLTAAQLQSRGPRIIR